MKKKMVNNKKEINSTLEILNFLTNKNKFKVTIILSFLLSIYGGFILSAGIKNYFNSAILTFQFPTFNVLLFLILFINTINVCSMFDKYEFYIIRLKDKKTYLKELIKIVVYSNIIVLSVIILTYFALLNLVEFQYLISSTFNNYINNIAYMFFYFVRYIIIALSMSILCTLSYVKFGEKKTLFVSIVFVAFFWVIGTSLETVNSFSFLPWKYFKFVKYGSFSLEINYSLLFILLIELIICLVYKLVNTRFNNKTYIYMILNDLEFLFREKYKEILLLILLPLLVLLIIYIVIYKDGIEILKMTLGLNLKKESFDIFNVAMLVFNIVIQLYLVLSLYAKDLKKGLDNIFLRLSSIRWYLAKEIITLFVTFFLKFIQYTLIIIILIISKKSNLNFSIISKIFLSDFLFTITIQHIFILTYFNIRTLPKIIECLLFVIIVAFAMIIPKNIMWYNQYQLILLIVNTIIILISVPIYKFNKRKVIQTMGGI